MFSSMGSFTAAFGMDKLNFGSFMGFYAVISGNMLSKEEKEHTVEFLFAHPLNRGQMQSCKLSALASQLTAMHVIAGKPVVVKYYIKIRKALAESGAFHDAREAWLMLIFSHIYGKISANG